MYFLSAGNANKLASTILHTHSCQILVKRQINTIKYDMSPLTIINDTMGVMFLKSYGYVVR